MLLTVFLALFVILLIYLLFVPIVLFIDTATNQYYIQLTGLAKASIAAHDEELLRIKLNVLFLNFYFYPLRSLGSAKRKKTAKKTTKRAIGKRRKKMSFRKVLRMLKTFKVKRFMMDIDTGEVILNAKLYPVFAFLNYRGANFYINFQGRNQLALHLQNRPINLIKSYINF